MSWGWLVSEIELSFFEFIQVFIFFLNRIMHKNTQLLLKKNNVISKMGLIVKASIASIYLSLPCVSEQFYLTKVHTKASKYSWDRIDQWNVCNGLYSMVCLALIFNNTDNGTLVLYVHVYEVFERCLLPESLKKSRLFYIKRY